MRSEPFIGEFVAAKTLDFERVEPPLGFELRTCCLRISFAVSVDVR
jgi:hypothetical protein